MIAAITFTVDPDLDPHGTSRQIQNVKASYHQLVQLFGEPERLQDADHSRVSWAIEFSDGESMFIYDWNDDRRIEDVTEWNIGGKKFMVAGRIYDILNNRPIIA